MTFMDDTERDCELEARKATRTLQIWLGTIAPVDSKLALDTKEKLREVIHDMGWKGTFDEQLNDYIVEVL
jgi:hypothetical protein